MAIITAMLSFIGTNLDDFFLLILLHSQTSSWKGRLKILLGQYFGIFTLVLFSLIARYGLLTIPQSYIRFLGLIPILLGIKYMRNRNQGQDRAPVSIRIITIAMLTIAGGGDNLGVYIPMFAAQSRNELICTVLTFAAMIPIWNTLAGLTSRIPVINIFLQRYKHYLLPVTLFLLGIIILISL